MLTSPVLDPIFDRVQHYLLLLLVLHRWISFGDKRCWIGILRGSHVSHAALLCCLHILMFAHRYEFIYTGVGQFVAAYAPNATSASMINPLIINVLSAFCGVLVPYAQMPAFWRYWLYYLNPVSACSHASSLWKAIANAQV